VASASDVDYRPPTPALVALILLGCLPLAARRRWPVPVFATCLTATVVIFTLGWNADWCGLATYVGLYTVATWRPLWVSGSALALMAGGEGALAMVSAPYVHPWNDLAGSLLPWCIGRALRHWRAQRDAALDRALEAERTRVATAERAVVAERLRIAGELHDLVSHTLSAVAVQAAVMRRQLGRETGIAGSALTTIEPADLTDREADVLQLVAHGLSNIEISEALRIGPATVKTYISRLLTKLDVTTRVHLVIYAYGTSFIQ
jgi:DNA-binding CsgD family transcriptional regulator